MDGQGLLFAAIWGGALLLWLAFLAFYDGLRRPLRRDEIDAFLTANGDNVYLAAADALEIIAANQAYILKVISNNGLSTNGPAVAASLQATAKTWRDKAASNVGTSDTGVIIVPNADDPYLESR